MWRWGVTGSMMEIGLGVEKDKNAAPNPNSKSSRLPGSDDCQANSGGQAVLEVDPFGQFPDVLVVGCRGLSDADQLGGQPGGPAMGSQQASLQAGPGAFRRQMDFDLPDFVGAFSRFWAEYFTQRASPRVVNRVVNGLGLIKVALSETVLVAAGLTIRRGRSGGTSSC